MENQQKTVFKVGSPMRGCHQCGETKEVETKSGRTRKVFTSGFNVFRAYKPLAIGWTFWCHDCGAKDAVCWPNAQYGTEPVLQPKDDIPLTALPMSNDGSMTLHINYENDYNTSNYRLRGTPVPLRCTVYTSVETPDGGAWENEGGACAPEPVEVVAEHRYRAKVKVHPMRKQKAAQAYIPRESIKVVPREKTLLAAITRVFTAKETA